ncbi:MAG: hypothetical protein ACK42E_03720 [Candidatus Bipolaricaulaceae bacterium]
MIRYLVCETKIAVPWGIFLVPFFFAVLRLTKAVSPEEPMVWEGWISFLEFVLPILFPVFSFTLLDQEKRWRTVEVMVATRRRKATVFLVRYLAMVFSLFCAVIAAVQPKEYILLLAPGLALGGMALLFGFVFGEETGLGLALGWWCFSIGLRVARNELLKSGVQSWVLLTLFGSALPRSELLLRKWAHLGIGVFLTLLALTVAEWKRSWSPK